MNLDISFSLCPPRAQLVLAGELDAFDAADLRRRFDTAVAHGCLHVTVDTSRLTFIDAGGLGTLVRLHNTVRRQGGTVQVSAASPALRRVVDIAALGDVLGQTEVDRHHPGHRRPA